MSQQPRIFDEARSDKRLVDQLEALFVQQRATWQTLREGEKLLAGTTVKELRHDRDRVVVQGNPGRRQSIHARVDPVSVGRRACFLCTENMPPEERCIAFEELLLFPNPYPVLGLHLTVPSREHLPQEIRGRVGSMLRLSRALGQGMLVFYNGARCGASAPDHFHFQACKSDGVPLLEQLPDRQLREGVTAFRSFGRGMLVCRDTDAERMVLHLERILEALSRINPEDEEPMVNIVAVFRDERHHAVLFPRARHRPAAFFAEGPSRISVSPAALEMAGILVVADPDHLERVDERAALAIYGEVSFREEEFTRLVEMVT
jgi:hypothetical protein